MSDGLVPTQPFAPAVVASAGTWAPVAIVVAGAVWWGSAWWQPLPFVQAAGWLLSGLVVMPLLFVVAIGAAVASLSVLLAALALPWALLGRPTGLAAALAAVWALPASILPGYWRALRRVRRPGLWGAVVGFLVGIGLFLLVRGGRP
ncbi:MAG: hypothetical protein MUC36_23945 [Planctomycetes bacterium]|jgi:hypothetical protein|nr:hypothetical protein [Planctomycetota bacterium]